MKKILALLTVTFFNVFNSQVAIGKTAVSNSSVSLEFGAQNRGLLLPWVTSATTMTNTPNGTICFDLIDNRIKIKYAVGWQDFSQNSLGTTIDPVTTIDGRILQDPLTDIPTAKTSIGSSQSSSSAILILEDNNKAMILPKVASPHYNIINPSPGMMVYDTDSKMFAVFNGSMWTYWR
ncbi:hypothetical protein BOQ62_09880 [Chryseobacterium sp. CH21]|uniref:hypothetical protein n=1 Tax=Chryseobacterium sp. CH21 TaxID=713556 RepID=UPI00100B65C5|nr:hypothetical protein [Chryseobacterium sp. CH21]RXM39726.1 hypothetical protein BOQ62_09880 [Chryseobacterium sp. CH21]